MPSLRRGTFLKRKGTSYSWKFASNLMANVVGSNLSVYFQLKLTELTENLICLEMTILSQTFYNNSVLQYYNHFFSLLLHRKERNCKKYTYAIP